MTDLGNTFMPLIRYEIGDWAEVGPACRCGRGLPTLTRVLGRPRNMLILPDGDSLWPRLNSGDLSLVAPIQQFQLVQESLDRIELKYRSEEPITAEMERKVTELMCARLGHPFRFSFTHVDDLPRSKSGMYEVFVREFA